jgi:inorganic phosphate transporter, PiT family
VIASSVMGAGAAKRVSAVRWGVAGNIAVAWALTIPAAGLFGGVVYGITTLFGSGAAGPLVISIAMLIFTAVALARRLQRGSPITAEA